MAQPSLSHDSIRSHQIVVHQDGCIGRYTDFVEEMALVFQGTVWERFWSLILPDANPWGWGYDEFAYSFCGFRRMAIIDAEVIRHTHAGSYHETAIADHHRARDHFRRFHLSRKRTLCVISSEPWRKHVIVPVRLMLYHIFVALYALRPVFFFRRAVRTCAGYLRAMTSVRKDPGFSVKDEDSGDKSYESKRA